MCAFNLEWNMPFVNPVSWNSDDIEMKSIVPGVSFDEVLQDSDWYDGVPMVYYGFAAYTLNGYRFRKIMWQAVYQSGYLASDMPKMVSEALEVDTGILEKLEEGIKSYM